MFSSGGTCLDSNVYQKACEHVCQVLGNYVDQFLIYGLRVKLTQFVPRYAKVTWVCHRVDLRSLALEFSGERFSLL